MCSVGVFGVQAYPGLKIEDYVFVTVLIACTALESWLGFTISKRLRPKILKIRAR